MKRITTLLAMTMVSFSLFGQAPSARDGSFFTFPALRYSVCHMRQYLPTTNVPRNNTARITPFRYRLDMDAIDRLTFIPLGHTEPMTWRESLTQNYADGVIILHKGRVVYERYFENLTPEGVHAVMSVTKSFTGTLAATLVAEGKLDPTRLVSYYIPELAGSGFGDATVREVMDMTTAIRYSEEYTDPNAEVWAFSAAGNPFADHPAGTPQGYHDYLRTVRKDGTHGEQFGYRTVNTEVLGWIVERVGGATVAEQLQRRIWGRMGMEQDAYYQVDAVGTPFAGGGLNASLRDLARFGEMMLQGGRWQGRQIIPAEVVEDIRFGSNVAPFAASDYGKKLPGWSYRNMWWVSNNADGAFMARGVHGQAIYIDPAAEMVIVRLASNPNASNTLNDYISLPAYQAVADYLMGR
ncbi:MAG: serine hydrolase [Tidjanibacter sp.]|nr:serine hydrolase [Tidjanibacter sp.]